MPSSRSTPTRRRFKASATESVLLLNQAFKSLVAKNVQEGRLRATESSVDAFADVDAAIVCVSTPSMPDGSVDIRPMMRVFDVLAESAETCGRPRLVLVRSTIAPGMLRRVLDRHRTGSLRRRGKSGVPAGDGRHQGFRSSSRSSSSAATDQRRPGRRQRSLLGCRGPGTF